MLDEKERMSCLVSLLSDEDHLYNIVYILKKTTLDNDIQYKVIGRDIKDSDNIVELIKMNDENIFNAIPEWDFNVDEHLLSDLEDGYEFAYAPLNEHYNIWSQIESVQDDINHQQGLQEYLKHCKQNNINVDTLETLGLNHIDISNKYHEINQSYSIICEEKCNEESIVMGFNATAPSPYVTWKSTPNRKYGYDSGHYFNDYNDAYFDLKTRSHELLDNHLNRFKQTSKPIKYKKDKGDAR